MQKVIFTVIILLALALPSQAQNWAHVFGPYGGDVEAIASDRFGHIYAGTDSGVFVSSNNGASWVEKNNGLSEEEIFSFTCAATGTVLAGTEGGGIFRSTNFGDSWNAVNSGLPDSSNILSLASDDRGNIYAGHAGQGVFYSSDDGQHWLQRSVGMPNTSVYSLTIAPSGNIYAGVTRYILESTDRGEHWVAVDSAFPGGDEVLALAADSSGEIYAGSFKGVIKRTQDGGAFSAWEDVTPSIVTEVKALAAAGQYVFAGLFGGAIIRSQTKGLDWAQIGDDSLTDVKIYGMTVSPNGYLFVGTFDADIFRSVFPVFSSGVVKEVQQGQHQVWPQPCESSATIEFLHSSDEPVTIAIEDLAGRRVKTIDDGVIPSDVQRITVDCSDLTTGVYIALIKAGDGVRAFKIIKQ